MPNGKRTRRPNPGANLVSRRNRTKKRTHQTPTVTFTRAYNMLLPSKEIRVNMAETFPTDSGVGTVDNTKTYELTNISQGTQANQRTASSIWGAYLHIKGVVSNESVSEGKGFRMMVLREVNKGDLNPATLSNLYLTPTGSFNQAPVGTSDDLKFNINRNIYRVLLDRRYTLEAQGQGASKLINEKIRIGQEWFYPYASTGNVCNGGRLFIVINACEVDTAPTTSTIINMDLIARFFFKDSKRLWRSARHA